MSSHWQELPMHQSDIEVENAKYFDNYIWT